MQTELTAPIRGNFLLLLGHRVLADIVSSSGVWPGPIQSKHLGELDTILPPNLPGVRQEGFLRSGQAFRRLSRAAECDDPPWLARRGGLPTWTPRLARLACLGARPAACAGGESCESTSDPVVMSRVYRAELRWSSGCPGTL
jgi:hypothetical protein